jgi:hypothetical protein
MGSFFMFCAPGLVFGGTEGVGSIFMFCAPGLVFGGIEGVKPIFHVLRFRTRFSVVRGAPGLISTVLTASGPVFMFCASGLIFGGAKCAGSRFHVLRSRTHFRRYRVRLVSLSCFARLDSFTAVPKASDPVFIFCATGFVFDGTEGVGSRFHVLRTLTHFRRYRGRYVAFSYFARMDSFSTVPRASSPVLLFSVPKLIFGGTEGVPSSCFSLPDMFSAVPRASCPVLMFCAPGHFFGGTKGVGSLFHVLRSLTHFRRYKRRRVLFFDVLHVRTSFRRYKGRRVPFSCFTHPGLIFDGTEDVGSIFHVLRSRIRFRRYRGRRVSFSFFALPDSFSMVSGSFFMFCAPGLIFDGTEGVGSRFHVLRYQTLFRRYKGRRVLFSCFVRSDSFSAVPRASGPVFMLCVAGHVFGGTEGVGYRYRRHRGRQVAFHVLRSRTRFRQYRGLLVPLSCFARPDSFSAVPKALGLIFIFCAPWLIFSSTEGVGSCFMFCVPGLFFDGTEGIGSRFHVLRSRTHFRRYRGRRVLFSCFALPDSFTVVQRASGPIFIFCATGLVFNGTGASGPFFMFCAPDLVFGGTEGVESRFHVLCSRTHFRRCRVRRVPFSCFALPDSFLAVPRTFSVVIMFCAQTHFRRYRERRVPFSCFALQDSFSAIQRVSGPVLMFCAPRLVFGVTEGVGSIFHVLRFRTRFRRY